MRITTANNLIVGSIIDNGSRFQVSGSTTLSSTLSVGSRLTLTGAGTSEIYTTDASGLYLTAATSGGMYIASESRFIFRKATSPFTEYVRVETNGNLMVNTSIDLTYASKLQVSGDTYITGVFRETITTNTQTASYSLVLSDNGKLILMNVATANNLTIPLNSSINFPVGTKIDVSSIGAGQTTIVATGGVTINSAGGALKLRLQYSGATLVQTATNVWSLFGDITT
jgi:hypothetical protein